MASDKGLIDKDTLRKLIVIGAVLIAIIVAYYVVSPYQNCMRGIDDDPDEYDSYECQKLSDW